MNLQLYLFKFVNILLHRNPDRGRRDRMVVGFSNYLYNNYLSPLKLWVRILPMAMCTPYNI